MFFDSRCGELLRQAGAAVHGGRCCVFTYTVFINNTHHMWLLLHVFVSL